MALIMYMLSIRHINHVIQVTKNEIITDHCNTMSRMQIVKMIGQLVSFSS